MNVSKQRRQAMDALGQLAATNEAAASEIMSYIARLEIALDTSFDLLSRNNTYTPHINKAWKLLGETVDKTHSRQKPFNLDDDGNYIGEW